MPVSLQQIARLVAKHKLTVSQIADKLGETTTDNVVNCLRRNNLKEYKLFRVMIPDQTHPYWITTRVVDDHARQFYNTFYVLTQAVAHFYPHLPSSQSNLKQLRDELQKSVAVLDMYIDQPQRIPEPPFLPPKVQDLIPHTVGLTNSEEMDEDWEEPD